MITRSLSFIFVMLSFTAFTVACQHNADTDKGFDKTTQFIINGVADTSVDHNAVVALYLKDATGTCNEADGISCTGTLIHPQYVLTAAHCVAETKKGFGIPKASPCNPFFKIGIGNDESEVALNLYDIENIYFSRNYKDVEIDKDYETSTADIALIRLKEKIPASVAKPILSLPPWLGLSTASLGENGHDMEFSGFGYDDHGNFGQKLKFTTKATRYCGASNPNDAQNGCRVGKISVTGCHPNPDICHDEGYINQTGYVHLPYGSFYYSQKDGGPCQGDSGGPGFVTIGGVEYVASVTSYGDSICAAYGVSGASQDFYDWILSFAPEIADTYVEICDNGIDDDGNGKTDCDDTACADATNCNVIVKEICDNGIDDDKNGKTDCDDTACLNAANCSDDTDDSCQEDADGNIDCSDLACADEPECSSTDEFHKTACSSTTRTRTSNPLSALILSIMAMFALLTVRLLRPSKAQH